MSADSPAIRKNPDNDGGDVLAQLIGQLYQEGPKTVAAGILVALVIYLGIRGAVDDFALNLWAMFFSAVTASRFLLVSAWRRRGRRVGDQARWARFYTVGALGSGLVWGALVLFIDPLLSEYQRIFLLVTLMGMPVAAMPGNSIYLPVYYTFTVPVILALLFWSLVMSRELSPHFTLVTLAFACVLWVTAFIYHRSLRRAIESRLQNELLVQRLFDANSQLEQLAYFDSLTSLPNRRWFQERIEKALAGSRPLALMLIDLDNFKQVNDRFGHDTGDRLLKIIAERLRSFCNQVDNPACSAVSRFGGDEFTLLLEGAWSREEVVSYAQALLDALGRETQLSGEPLNPGASIGVALFPDHAAKFGGLMRSADIAMYKAKKRGGHQFQIFDPRQL